MKQIFQTKNDLNELWRFNTGTGNIYTANVDQIPLTVFTLAFCFAHARYNLIKFGLSRFFYSVNLNKQTIAAQILPKFSQSKGNQTIKLVYYNKRNIFIRKS